MSDWIRVDDEPQPDGIVGGEGACDSVSIRFQHKTEPAMVTVYLYAIDLEDRGYTVEDTDGQMFDVEEMIVLSVGTDPDNIESTEIWSDYVFDRPSQLFFDTVLDAEDYRDREAVRWLDMGTFHFLSWDGFPERLTESRVPIWYPGFFISHDAG